MHNKMKQFFKDCFFQINNIRVLASEEKYSRGLVDPHVHSYWEVKTLPDGNDTTASPLVILVPPNAIHGITPGMFQSESAWVIAFTQPRVILQMSSGAGEHDEYFCLFSQVDDLCPGGVASVLRKIQTLSTGKPAGGLLEKLLNDLFSLLFSAVDIALRNSPEAGLKTGFSVRERARDYIERQYYRGDLTVEKIAAYTGVTAGHLANLFKDDSLGTVRQYLIMTRLRHAARLLSTGRYTVKDVAELTGWNNQFYFSNCFRKHYKMSPSEIPLQPETKYV